jgi:hypothetical protein
MKESNQLLIDLLDYIEQVEKLNRKPVYTVPSDILMPASLISRGFLALISTSNPDRMMSGFVSPA